MIKKCKEYDFEGKNNARLKYHMLKQHFYQCDVCKRNCAGKEKFKSHKLLNTDSNRTLSDEQVNLLSHQDQTEILNWPETPKRKSLKYKLWGRC